MATIEDDGNSTARLAREARRLAAFPMIAGVLLLTFIIGSIVVWSASARSVAHDFLNALRDRDYERAYSLGTPALQKEVGSPRALRSIVEKGPGLYAPWAWTSLSFHGDQITLRSEVNRDEGNGSFAILRLEKTAGVWKVAAANTGTPEGRLHVP